MTDDKYLRKLAECLHVERSGDPYTCVRPGCSNRSLMPFSYCMGPDNCARQDAARLGKVPKRSAHSVSPLRSVRSIGRGISGAVKQAQAEVFRMKYPSYEDFVEARKVHRPDAFAGKDYRGVRNATHNLSVYYGVSFPKDVRSNEARCSWLQGWANGQADEAIGTHVRDSIAQALTRDYEAQERELRPIELLEALKVRHGR